MSPGIDVVADHDDLLGPAWMGAHRPGYDHREHRRKRSRTHDGTEWSRSGWSSAGVYRLAGTDEAGPVGPASCVSTSWRYGTKVTRSSGKLVGSRSGPTTSM